MSLLLWLAWMSTLVRSVGDAPVSAPMPGQEPPSVQMEILIARVDRSALRAQGIRFPEALAGDQPTATAIKDRQRFVTFLRELQRKKLAAILAEPVIVTTSGRLASLASHLGKEAARSVPSLTMLPQVQQGEQIRVTLDVAAPPAKKGPNGADSVAIQVRDGQTLALTGLVFKQVTASSAKVPVLGDLPLVGSLFSSVSYAEVEYEWLVFVTPRVMGDH